MSRKTERMANLIRNTLGELLLSKMADPRFDPARTSITRVEVPEDLMSAKVFVSVADDEAAQKKTIQALSHAAGHMQKEMMRRIQLRHTPVLEFVLDEKFKKTLQTLQLISKAMDEIRQDEQRRQAENAEGEDQGDNDQPQSDQPEDDQPGRQG